MRLRYVQHDVDRHGNERWYYRRKGYPLVRLPSPGSREFAKAYLEATAGGKRAPAQPDGDTIAGAVAAYYQHNRFTTLAAASQTQRRRVLENFRAKYGPAPVAGMQSEDVAKMIGKLGPFAARNWVQALRALMQFAIATGLRKDDPTTGVKLPSGKTDGFHTWTEEEIAQYEARHPVGTKARLAMALLLYTAARRADAIQFGPQHVRAGVLTYRQQKTGVRLNIPMHAKLIEIIAATPTDHLTFLVTYADAPYSTHGFGNLFRRWCREAGLPNCSAHGLRKAAARRLAEAGCSAPQIAAITGHKTLSQVQHYIEAAEQTRLAQAAMEIVSRT
jgi:integrase